MGLVIVVCWALPQSFWVCRLGWYASFVLLSVQMMQMLLGWWPPPFEHHWLMLLLPTPQVILSAEPEARRTQRISLELGPWFWTKEDKYPGRLWKFENHQDCLGMRMTETEWNSTTERVANNLYLFPRDLICLYEVLQLLWDDGIKAVLIRTALSWATQCVVGGERPSPATLMGVWSNNVRKTHTRRA